MSSIFTSLDLSRNSFNSQSLDEIECSECTSPLDLHQPDKEIPERLVGTCPDCHAWYLIDAATGLMALLPDETDLRNA